MSKSLNVLKMIDCDWLCRIPIANEDALKNIRVGVTNGVKSLGKNTTVSNVLLSFDISDAALYSMPSCVHSDDREVTNHTTDAPAPIYANRTMLFLNGGSTICMVNIYTGYAYLGANKELSILDQSARIVISTMDKDRDPDEIRTVSLRNAKTIEQSLDRLFAAICPN